MQWDNVAVMMQWDSDAMGQCGSGTVMQWDNVGQWDSDAVGQRGSGTVMQRDNVDGTVMQWDNVAVGQ